MIGFDAIEIEDKRLPKPTASPTDFGATTVADRDNRFGPSVAELELRLAEARRVEAEREQRERSRREHLEQARRQTEAQREAELPAILAAAEEAIRLSEAADGAAPLYARQAARAFLHAGQSPFGSPDAPTAQIAELLFDVQRRLADAGARGEPGVGERDLDAVERALYAALVQRANVLSGEST